MFRGFGFAYSVSLGSFLPSILSDIDGEFAGLEAPIPSVD